MEQAVLKINGMSCQGCVRSVKKVLQAISGVHSVEVSLDSAQAVLVFDPAQAQLAQLKAAVEAAGYPVEA